MKPNEAVEECRVRIERSGSPVQIVRSGPIDLEDVQIAEEVLGAAFPPAYVELVTGFGPFKLADDWDSPSRRFELLCPSRMLIETDRYRRLASTVRAQAGVRASEFGLLQFAVSPVDFFVLRLKDGTVHFNVHDDVFDWSHGRSFEDHLADVLRQIEEHVRESLD